MISLQKCGRAAHRRCREVGLGPVSGTLPIKKCSIYAEKVKLGA